jgi:hypothetical protein
MNELNDIQKLWGQQKPEGEKASLNDIKDKAQQRVKASRKELWISITVLGTLSVFLFLIILQLPDLKWPYGPGLLTMFLSVAIRTGLEYVSVLLQKKLNIGLSPELFRTKLISYHKLRRQLVGIVTITSMTLYVIGFCIMIPGFKPYMPIFMFYSVIGFIVVMVPVFSVFLYKKAKEEMSLLKKTIEELE